MPAGTIVTTVLGNHYSQLHYDGITQLTYTQKIAEGNLSIFVYRLFREVFTPLIRSSDERSENFMKQPVDKYRKISFCNLCV